jgi:hypothetical protein
MIAAKGAGADDCDAERGHSYFFVAAEAGDSTASRQRA